MSAELFLQRFDPSSNDGPKRPGILADLASLARRVLADEGRKDDFDVDMASDGQSVTINFEGGTAELHATHGSFPLGALDKATIRLVFEIAKEGDMVIVIEGGKYRAILTDPRQRNALPPNWVGDQAEAPVCPSAAELEVLLRDWSNVQRRYADQMRRDVVKRTVSSSSGAIPGTDNNDDREYVYIQVRPGETALKHFNLAGKNYRRGLQAGTARRPRTGAMGGTAWRLAVPSGEAFYALWVFGDKRAWLAFLREYASSAGLAVGRIVNADTFVLDDGRSFPLVACTCTKVKE